MSTFVTHYCNIDLLDTLISSKTRIRLLLRFFLNPENTSYLRGLADETGESTNSIRVELNRLEEAGMLDSFNQGNKKLFKVNQKHPLFFDVRNIILKYVGIDQIIENVINRLGNVGEVYVLGEYAQGKDSGVIDLLLLGEVDHEYLNKLTLKVEKVILRKIRHLVYINKDAEFENHLNNKAHLLIWKN